MARLNIDTDVSERARTFVASQFSARGRFTLLEKMSGVSSAQWQNFYYAKQGLNDKMLAFLVKNFPHDEIWLLTGRKAPKQSDFPFSAPIPKSTDSDTVGKRLNWVIRQFAGPKGLQLFKYLEQRSEGGDTKKSFISADEWAPVVLGLAEPNLRMVEVVCAAQPMFTQWVVLGYTSSDQVDPTNEVSVKEWKARQEAEWKETERAFLTKTKHGNKKS
ncbi:hypothetical protein [Rhodoferax sp. GW822-FHT02A01]|uniref:hypothetical protein n=1 Tax=Rhodoferax sp. GW822-FHT02A01 TaxID=3141537 RepID=UPI00315D890A